MSRTLKVAELGTWWYKECPFRKSFWFRAAFEDGEEENTLSIVGQGHLMISSEPIELSEFCSSIK